MSVPIVTRNKRQGKHVQKILVERLGGKNVGTIEGQDGEHEHFSIEIKHRAKFIGEAFMLQAEKNCPEGKIPLLVVHSKGKNHNDDLVLIRLKEWEKIYGKINKNL